MNRCTARTAAKRGMGETEAYGEDKTEVERMDQSGDCVGSPSPSLVGASMDKGQVQEHLKNRNKKDDDSRLET